MAGTFTLRGSLDVLTWNGTQIEDRNYDPGGRLTSIDRAFTDETRTYDTKDRLTSIENTGVGTVSYTYDSNFNKLSETWTGAMAAWNFTTEDSNDSNYPDGYDAEDRFRRFDRPGQNEQNDLARSMIGNINDLVFNGASNPRSYSSVYELTDLATRNQQWSITALVDLSDGSVIERYAYDVFGKRRIIDPTGTDIKGAVDDIAGKMPELVPSF